MLCINSAGVSLLLLLLLHGRFGLSSSSRRRRVYGERRRWRRAASCYVGHGQTGQASKRCCISPSVRQSECDYARVAGDESIYWLWNLWQEFEKEGISILLYYYNIFTQAGRTGTKGGTSLWTPPPTTNNKSAATERNEKDSTQAVFRWLDEATVEQLAPVRLQNPENKRLIAVISLGDWAWAKGHGMTDRCMRGYL